MMIIPAIDLMDGKCVRLVKGKKEDVKYYEEDPLELAEQYSNQGAQIQHVIDLDGAFTGKMKNISIIKKLAQNISIQVGGGVRDEKTIKELMDAGAKKVILSSILIKDPVCSYRIKKRYARKIVGSFDFKGNDLVYEGWIKNSSVNFENLSKGFNEIIITDTTRDGTLVGPNIEFLKSIKKLFNGRVIAAGGIGKLADIAALKKAGIYGAVLGKALLDRKISLREAITCSQKE